jgi:ribosomal protein L1
MTKIGLREFKPDQLESNLDALMEALANRKPEAIKGRYFLKGMVKTSMGPTIKLDL